MFATLSEFKSALLSYATAEGQGPSRPKDFVFNEAATGYDNVRITVAHSEPYATTMPLNLIWFVQSGADSGKLLRRTLRSPSGGYQHTWEEVTTIEGLWVTQNWDTAPPTNLYERDHVDTVGNPHHTTAADVGALSIGGGTMEGPLHTRIVAVYELTEAVPRSWIEALVNPVRALAQSTRALQTNLNSQFINLRNRVVVLEGRQGAVRVLVSPFIDSTSINVVHNFNRPNVLVEIYNDDNEMVIPAKIKVLSSNEIRVEFAEPVVGRIEVSPKAVF